MNQYHAILFVFFDVFTGLVLYFDCELEVKRLFGLVFGSSLFGCTKTQLARLLIQS